jgi:phosphoribosyl 1,2-cyclic phosphate phosphodiesterase
MYSRITRLFLLIKHIILGHISIVNKLKVTFLGTGTSQGVPVIACPCPVCNSPDERDKRLRTSVFIETGDKKIVIDTGPDFMQQMLRAGIKELDAILYTHDHKDHIAGLDDVRAFNFIHQRAIDVFLEDRVIPAIKREFSYIFAESKYPGIPRINLNTIDTFSFQAGGIDIMPIRAFHYRLPVLGFRIGDFTYITDANYLPEEEKEKLIGSRFIVINALRKQKHISHFSLSEAVKLINEFGPRRAYITHISHQMGLHEEVQKELPPNILLAFDGLSFEV